MSQIGNGEVFEAEWVDFHDVILILTMMCMCVRCYCEEKAAYIQVMVGICGLMPRFHIEPGN